MDKRLFDELSTLLGEVRGDVLLAKVQAIESGDGSERLWLIAKLIWAVKCGTQAYAATGELADRLKVDATLELALKLTGWEAAEL